MNQELISGQIPSGYCRAVVLPVTTARFITVRASKISLPYMLRLRRDELGAIPKLVASLVLRLCYNGAKLDWKDHDSDRIPPQRPHRWLLLEKLATSRNAQPRLAILARHGAQ